MQTVFPYQIAQLLAKSKCYVQFLNFFSRDKVILSSLKKRTVVLLEKISFYILHIFWILQRKNKIWNFLNFYGYPRTDMEKIGTDMNGYGY
jgi:hypothetical protein